MNSTFNQQSTPRQYNPPALVFGEMTDTDGLNNLNDLDQDAGETTLAFRDAVGFVTSLEHLREIILERQNEAENREVKREEHFMCEEVRDELAGLPQPFMDYDVA